MGRTLVNAYVNAYKKGQKKINKSKFQLPLSMPCAFALRALARFLNHKGTYYFEPQKIYIYIYIYREGNKSKKKKHYFLLFLVINYINPLLNTKMLDKIMDQ